MPYIENRSVHDADAHVVETPDWLHAFADPDVRDRLPQLYLSTVRPGEETLIESMRRRHADSAYRALDEQEILLRKNWSATGSFIKEDRPRALDLLGVKSQLIFNTFLNNYLSDVEHVQLDVSRIRQMNCRSPSDDDHSRRCDNRLPQPIRQ